jgi:hypothetical protein
MKYLFFILGLVFCFQSQAQTTPKKPVKPPVQPAPAPAPKKTPVVRQALSEFRKIQWGTRMDSILINGVKPVFLKATEFGKSESNAFYIENDDLSIGTIQLQKILYVFTIDSALSRVVLVGDKKKFGEMKYIIAYKFGEPVIEDKQDGYDCVWSLDECKIRLSFFNDQQVFTTNFYSDYENSYSKKVNRSVDDF